MEIVSEKGDYQINKLIFKDIHCLKLSLEFVSKILESRLNKNKSDIDAKMFLEQINTLHSHFANESKKTTETAIGILETILNEELENLLKH